MVDKRYEATIEKPTAKDSGRNIARAAPDINSVGTNIARMHSMASNRGTVVSIVASREASLSELPRVKCV